MRNRKVQRTLAKLYGKEESLDRNDSFGRLDLTPYNAIKCMNGNKNITLR